MKSNYKRLGDYIEPCDEFNDNMEVSELLGISNNKYFQKSHTNTIGIDLSKYRVVRTKQFAFNRATTRNGEKISIALRQGNDCIVSPSYRVFQSKDENELDSEYLMMWFKRPEFDRYARFKSHGSAHEFFDLEEMYEVQLPVPSIEKQREIVAEYNTVQNRMALNNQLIQELEETAQALYKHWFVAFEFPDENGNPYKSSGGEMVESELGEIPKGWEVNQWLDIATLEYGKSLTDYRSDVGNIPVYGTNGKIGVTKKPLVNSEGIIIGRKGVYRGVHYSPDPFFVIDTAFYLKPIRPMSFKWAFYEICRFDINGMETGSAIPSTSREDFYSLKSVFPSSTIQEEFEKKITVIFKHLELKRQESILLESTGELFHSKLATIESVKPELAIA